MSDAPNKRVNSRLADWIFQPSLPGYSSMDWDNFAAIAGAGYRYASDALRDPVARAAAVHEPA